MLTILDSGGCTYLSAVHPYLMEVTFFSVYITSVKRWSLLFLVVTMGYKIIEHLCSEWDAIKRSEKDTIKTKYAYCQLINSKH